MAPSPKLRILLVDDERSVRDMVHNILAGAGLEFEVEIETAESCEEALAWLGEHGEEVGAVLLDVGFGAERMQGDEALVRIKQRWPDLEVVMFTAGDDVSVAIRCGKAGAFEYVVKGPMMIAALPQYLRRIASTHAINAELADARRRIEHLECRRRAVREAAPRPQGLAATLEAVVPLEDVDRVYALHVLELCGGNRTRAAKLLDVEYPRFSRMLVRWGVGPKGGADHLG